jgi:hypothetical protein
MNDITPNSMTSNRHRNRGGFGALAAGLRHGLQWRLLLASTLLLLLPTLLLALPVAGWLQQQLGHSAQAAAIAGGNDLPLLAEGLLGIGKHGAWLGGGAAGATLLALLLAPWLTGMVVASIRAGHTLRLGALLRAGLGEYLRMLRMLAWSLLPMGIALGLGLWAMNMAETSTKHAILASEAEAASRIALAAFALLLVLAHASVEAGRARIGADPSLRSVIRAWWRGCRLLLRRPLATVVVYLGTSIVGYGLALAFGVLRVQVGGDSWGRWLAGLVMTQLVVAMLVWGRAARLYGLAELAAGASQPAQAATAPLVRDNPATSNEVPALA